VRWTRKVAKEKRAAYANDDYWGKPVSGFGDPCARIVVLGLAPGAHGANRTGRVFTGDRSGEWLFAAMHRAGLANQPDSIAKDDGLELHDAWVTVAVRCAPPANKPTPAEQRKCTPFLERELASLTEAKVIVCLGSFALRAISDILQLKPLPKFGHGAVIEAGKYTLVCISPQPAEHVHGATHRADARRRVRYGGAPGAGLTRSLRHRGAPGAGL